MANEMVSTYALCNFSDVREFVGVTNFSDEDTRVIMDLVNNISAQIETYCDRNFKSREYTEYHDGHGDIYLFPNHYPIISVSAIYDDSDWEWGNDTLITASDYRIQDNRVIVLKSSTWSKDEQNIKIIYTAGYNTIPFDLKQVCIEETVRKWKNRREVDILAKTAEDGSITRYVEGFMPTTKLVLDKYRRKFSV